MWFSQLCLQLPTLGANMTSKCITIKAVSKDWAFLFVFVFIKQDCVTRSKKKFVEIDLKFLAYVQCNVSPTILLTVTNAYKVLRDLT